MSKKLDWTKARRPKVTVGVDDNRGFREPRRKLSPEELRIWVDRLRKRPDARLPARPGRDID